MCKAEEQIYQRDITITRPLDYPERCLSLVHELSCTTRSLKIAHMIGPPPLVGRASKLSPLHQETVEEGRQGLWVGEPEGADSQVAVGRKSYRASARVPGGCQGGMQDVAMAATGPQQREGEEEEREDQGSEGEEGPPPPRLFFPPCFPLFFPSPFFLSLPFHLLGGEGSRRLGCPRLTRSGWDRGRSCLKACRCLPGSGL